MKLRCLPPADVSADSVVDVRIPSFGANRLPGAVGIQCQQSLGVLNWPTVNPDLHNFSVGDVEAIPFVLPHSTVMLGVANACRGQVWSLTQFHNVDFSPSRIRGKK